MRKALLVCGASIALVSCRGRDDVGSQRSASDVELAVTVARAIDASPTKSDSILTAHGLTIEGLDSLMYVIASDSAKTAAYERGRR